MYSETAEDGRRYDHEREEGHWIASGTSVYFIREWSGIYRKVVLRHEDSQKADAVEQ